MIGTSDFNTLGQVGHYTIFWYCLKSLITLRLKLSSINSFTIIFALMKRQGQEKIVCEYCGKAFKKQGIGTHKRHQHGEVVVERKIIKKRFEEEKLVVKLKSPEPVKLSSGGSLGSKTISKTTEVEKPEIWELIQDADKENRIMKQAYEKRVKFSTWSKPELEERLSVLETRIRGLQIAWKNAGPLEQGKIHREMDSINWDIFAIKKNIQDHKDGIK